MQMRHFILLVRRDMTFREAKPAAVSRSAPGSRLMVRSANGIVIHGV